MKSTKQLGVLAPLFRYFGDSNASWLGKLFVLAAVVYVVSPVDLLPDVMPVIGWLDDIGVMTLAVAWMWKVVDRYREAPEQLPQVITTAL